MAATRVESLARAASLTPWMAGTSSPRRPSTRLLGVAIGGAGLPRCAVIANQNDDNSPRIPS